MHFRVYEFEVGVNDSILSGNEQQKVYYNNKNHQNMSRELYCLTCGEVGSCMYGDIRSFLAGGSAVSPSKFCWHIWSAEVCFLVAFSFFHEFFNSQELNKYESLIIAVEHTHHELKGSSSVQLHASISYKTIPTTSLTCFFSS